MSSPRSARGDDSPTRILFKTELSEHLGNKSFLIGLAGHGEVEDHRCDTLPRPTPFVGGETKLRANSIKGPEHRLKVMRLEATGTSAGFGHSAFTGSRPERTSTSLRFPIGNPAPQPGLVWAVLRFVLLQT